MHYAIIKSTLELSTKYLQKVVNLKLKKKTELSRQLFHTTEDMHICEQFFI